MNTNDVNPFEGPESEYGCVYGNRQSGFLICARPGEDDGGLMTLANSVPLPRKLKPIRHGDKLHSEDQHPLDILAGTLDKLPELGFVGGDCFEAPLGAKIIDVEERGGLACGVAKGDPGRFGPDSVAEPGTAWEGVSLSSSAANSVSESSGGDQLAVTCKRKRKRVEKMELFMEKLVGNMMKRQEKLHEQLLDVIEKKEDERRVREEAWKQQEMERMEQEEEARAQEMSRTLAIISLVRTVTGNEVEMEIPQPPKRPEQSGDGTKRDAKVCDSDSRRWPQGEMMELIAMRSEVEEKAGKGSIWDEISGRMEEKGYRRSAKKCKEKWENMNKYYRKVVEGGKKRADESKSCCYFQNLERFYKRDSRREGKME